MNCRGIFPRQFFYGRKGGNHEWTRRNTNGDRNKVFCYGGMALPSGQPAFAIHREYQRPGLYSCQFVSISGFFRNQKWQLVFIYSSVIFFI